MNRKPSLISIVLTILVGVTLILTAINPTAAYASAPALRATPTATNTPEPTATAIDATPTQTATPAPTETPISYEPSLSLQSDPTYIGPGGQVTFLYQISNLEKFTETTFLRFHVPFGFAPLNPEEGKYDETAGTFDFTVTVPEGKIAWLADETIVPPVGIYAELIQDETTVAEAKLELSELVEYKIETTGGTAEGKDGVVQVNFPAGAVSETLTVKVTEPSYEALPVQSLSGSPFEITAVSDSSKIEVTQFDQPIEIWVNYDEGNLNGSEDDILLFWYDPTDGQWKKPLSQWVDKENNRIVATTDHFTVFDTYNSNWQSAQTPTLSGFQTSDFTGSASFSVPIKVPAGPGGLQPSLGLSYSSMVVDGASSESQASWVGMGWSLTTSSIVRNGHGTNGILDDSYQLSLNGMSVELFPDANGKYHGSSENFYRVELTDPHNPDTSKWIIWDKSGNVYTFDIRANRANIIDDYCNDPIYPDFVAQDEGEPTTWSWSLSKVRNVYGQELTYTYTKDTHPVYYQDCNRSLRSVNTVDYVYPDTITYSNGQYRIFFDPITETEPNHRLDYKMVWGNLAKIHQTKLLEAIYVQQDSNSDGIFNEYDTVIREYRFTYANNQQAHIFPDLIWDAGGKTPTLLSVTEYGLGGYQNGNGPSLPPYTFTYGDGMHLTSATNGYGGTINFVYNDYNHNGLLEPSIGEVPWGESIPAGVDGGYPVINSNKRAGWSKRTGSGACFQGSGDNPVLRFYCEIKNPVKVNGDNSILPGRHYTVIAQVQSDLVGTHWGSWAKVGLVYKVGGAWQADQYSAQYSLPVSQYPPWNVTPVTIIFDVVVPADATEVMALMNSDGARVNSYKLIPVTTAYRVTQKTVLTGSDSLTFKYDYLGASTNTPSVSVAAGGSHPYIKPYTEFRGHSKVTVASPFGGRTETEFEQGDCYIGSPTKTSVIDINNITAQTSEFTYACTETEANLFLRDEDTRDPFLYGTLFNPLKYYWTRTVSETSNVLGTVSGSLTTDYTYDSASGNLLTQSTSGPNITSLTTHYEYYPNPGGEYHLLSLPSKVWVTNAGGTIAESRNVFGTFVDSNNISHDGILLKTRSLMRGSEYSQMSYGYDDWGNVISATTWTGYGTATSDPNEGARTATTIYDSVYHTYPLSITTPPPQAGGSGFTTTLTYNYALGVPLTATGPNGVSTMVSAEYDAFGRLIELIRPGDDSASPTLQIAYTGTNPFTVTLMQKITNGQFYSVTRQYDGLGRPTSLTAGGVTTIYQYGQVGGARFDKISMPGETTHFVTTLYDSLGRPSKVIAPDLTETNYAYFGLLTTVTDANSNPTSGTTDILGRTVFVDAPIGPDITFGYDDLGKLKTASRGGATTTMNYDLGGRKTSISDPDMGAWTYDYDALNNLLTQTDARGCTLTMNYDLLNRLDTKVSSGTYCGQQISVDYDYDEGAYGIGFRTSMEDGTSMLPTSWEYDERGRIVKETKRIDSQPFTTEWTYNSADIPLTMTYPDGEVVTYNYNERVLLQNVEGLNTYVFDTQYDPAGRVTSREIGNGLVQKFLYNAWNVEGGRLDAIVSGSGTWNQTTLLFTDTLQKLSYDYDDIGNITQIEQVVNFGANEIEMQAFTYDELNRLKNWTLTGSPMKNYDYDAAGNLWHKENITLEYNDANHVHAVTDANGNLYDYDDNGNMTRREITSGPEAGIYDLIYGAENRLVEVKKNDETIALFIFDGDGRRVKSVVDGEAILFVGGYYQKKGTEITKYYPGGAMRKYVIPQSMSVEYILGDHLGSASLMTDSLGNKVSEMRYSPWGEVRYHWVDPNLSTSPAYTLPKKTFTGQYSYIDDPSTTSATEGFGLMFYNARWYDPILGRFAQADTVVPGGVQGLDRYAYVDNNPIIHTDPSGLCPDSTEFYCRNSSADFEGYRKSPPAGKNPATVFVLFCGWDDGDPNTTDDDIPCGDGGALDPYDDGTGTAIIVDCSKMKKQACFDYFVEKILPTMQTDKYYVFVGHSAGADVALLAAKYFIDQGRATQLRGLILLDPSLTATIKDDKYLGTHDEYAENGGLLSILKEVLDNYNDIRVFVADGLGSGSDEYPFSEYGTVTQQFLNPAQNTDLRSYANYSYSPLQGWDHMNIAFSVDIANSALVFLGLR